MGARALASFIGVVAALWLAEASAQSCNTADRSVLLLLDLSGSMNAALPGGETRVSVARRAVKGVAALLPGEAQIALRVYGAQSPPARKNCEDTHLAVPFGPASKQGEPIGKIIDETRAQGYTPIAFSLQQTANDFPSHAKQRVIVLVSDGKETCKGDPVVAAKALAAKGFVVHTIGFIVDTAARMQLQSVARATGGAYFDAPVGPELPNTLKSAFSACKQTVTAPKRAGPGTLRSTSAVYPLPVFNSETGERVGTLTRTTLEAKLPAGIYEVQFGSSRWKGIEIKAGEITTINPGEVALNPTTGAEIVDSETGESSGRFDAANARVTVMPGLYDLKFRRISWRYIKIDGGKITELKLATIRLQDGLKWKKTARIVTQDGTEVFRFDAVTYRAVLPPGEYVVEIDDAKYPFKAEESSVFEVKTQ
jgi:hypothetical protein